MKKNTFFVLVAASLLALGACNQGNNNQNASKNEPASNPGGDSSIPEDPNKLEDLEESDVELEFQDLESNVMVKPVIKAYVDAMEEQETTLEKPYHLTSLYGPTDYVTMAGKSKSRSYGDVNKTYPEEETGGVDVCQYLGYNSNELNVPIVVKWNADGETYEEGKVKFWSKKDFSDLREAPITVQDDVASANLANLYRATKYRVQVFNDDHVSQSFEFDTADYPRLITLGNESKRVKNVRDIGGYMTSYGVRTNQGLIYRGYYIDDKSGGHGVNYNDDVDKVQKEVLKIGHEVDLQRESEINGRTESCLEGAKYSNLTLISYENFLTQDSYQNLPAVFKILAKADEEHVYFHCWGGADRTGMLAFFINAICGVSYTDLIEDFEITTESNSSVRCHMHNSQDAAFAKYVNAFVNEWEDYDPEATINENCYNWLVDVAEVDAEDLERVREIMIPGYADGDLDVNELIPVYTPDGDWITDNLSGWKKAKENAIVKCSWHRHSGDTCSICGYTKSE